MSDAIKLIYLINCIITLRYNIENKVKIL